ncbi:hypothetical protein D3C83_317640 [compost metagenome]
MPKADEGCHSRVNPVAPIGSGGSFGVDPRRRLASISDSPSGGTTISFAICARALAR